MLYTKKSIEVLTYFLIYVKIRSVTPTFVTSNAESYILLVVSLVEDIDLFEY